MSSVYTTNNGLEKPATGDQVNTWGLTLNNNADLIDQQTDGAATIDLTGLTAYALTIAPGQSSAARKKVIAFSGTPSALVTITIAPNTAQKMYFILNTTAQSLKFQQAKPDGSFTGSTLTVPSSSSSLIYCDGAGDVGPVFINTTQFASIYAGGNVNVAGALSVIGAITAGSLSAGSFTATSLSTGTISATGAITAPSIAVTGAVTGASVSASGDVSGSTSHISGQANVGSLVSAGGISGTGVTATNVTASSGVTANTLVANDSMSCNICDFKNLVMNGSYAATHTFGTGAGTGPAWVGVPALSDAVGTITFTTGTSPSANAPILTVDLVLPLTAIAGVFSPNNAAAATAPGIYIDFPISGSLYPQLRLNVGSTALSPSTAYSWTYVIIQ